MSRQVNIHEAKTHFSKLVEEVEAGGEVVVARAGKPILRLVKLDQEPPKRIFGFGKGILKNLTDEEWEAAQIEFGKLFVQDKPWHKDFS